MDREKLRNQFELETKKNCVSEQHYNDVGFSDRYVEWLEEKLLNKVN